MKAGFFGAPAVGARVRFRSSFREGVGTIDKITYYNNIPYISVSSEGVTEYAEILEIL